MKLSTNKLCILTGVLILATANNTIGLPPPNEEIQVNETEELEPIMSQNTGTTEQLGASFTQPITDSPSLPTIEPITDSSTTYFSPGKISIDKDCTITGKCIPNADCVSRTNDSRASKICQCKTEFTPQKDKKKCAKIVGKFCHSDEDCTAGAFCLENQCACMADAVLHSSGETCGKTIGAECDFDEECIESAECLEPIYFHDNKTCTCSGLLFPTWDGRACDAASNRFNFQFIIIVFVSYIISQALQFNH